jgi:phosphatidate cytidylyltransferase
MARPEGAKSELSQRVISGVVMAVVAIVTTILGNPLFALLWAALAAIVAYEWHRLTEGETAPVALALLVAAALGGALAGWLRQPVWLLVPPGCAVAAWFVTRAVDRRWLPAGAMYAALLPAATILCRGEGGYGVVLMFFLFAVVWGTDVCAYFAGRALGGPKLWPAVSPKKTWSGAIGGVLGAIILGALVLAFFNLPVGVPVVLVAVVLSALSQGGDLFESSLKRRFGAKDSGHIIPGHGGFMDRLDGFIVAAVAAAAIGLLRGGSGRVAEGVLLW